MGITREEIKNLLKEAIEPLERKLDNLNNGFQELKRLIDFVNGKYDDVLVQLKQANEKIQRQGTSLKQMRKDDNFTRTNFVIIKLSKKKDDQVNIKIGSADGTINVLQRKQKIKYLGVLLDETISFNHHISYICTIIARNKKDIGQPVNMLRHKT